MMISINPVKEPSRKISPAGTRFGIGFLGITLLGEVACLAHRTYHPEKEIAVIEENAVRKEIEKQCYHPSAQGRIEEIIARPLDQIFRDYDGYRLYFRDSDGRVIEEQYSNEIIPHPLFSRPTAGFKGLQDGLLPKVVVFRDLMEGEQSFARTLDYTIEGCLDKNGPRKFRYVEVHLARNQGLAAGTDSFTEAKTRKYKPMLEIK